MAPHRTVWEGAGGFGLHSCYYLQGVSFTGKSVYQAVPRWRTTSLFWWSAGTGLPQSLGEATPELRFLVPRGRVEAWKYRSELHGLSRGTLSAPS